MEVFVNNNIATELMKFIYYFLTSFSTLWELISYEFFVLPLQWLNNFLGFKPTDPIYFEDYSISILNIGTTALLLFLIIHFVILVHDFIWGDN